MMKIVRVLLWSVFFLSGCYFSLDGLKTDKGSVDHLEWSVQNGKASKNETSEG